MNPPLLKIFRWNSRSFNACDHNRTIIQSHSYNLRILFIVLNDLSGEYWVTGTTRRISQSAYNSQYPTSASNIVINGLSSAFYHQQLTTDFMKNVKDFKSASKVSALRMGSWYKNVWLLCLVDLTLIGKSQSIYSQSIYSHSICH